MKCIVRLLNKSPTTEVPGAKISNIAFLNESFSNLHLLGFGWNGEICDIAGQIAHLGVGDCFQYFVLTLTAP